VVALVTHVDEDVFNLNLKKGDVDEDVDVFVEMEDESIPAPSIVGLASRSGNARPGSPNGVIGPDVYSADLSDGTWFDDNGFEITSFAIYPPTLPEGLVFNSATGALTYTPVTVPEGGEIIIEVTATNEGGESAAITIIISVGAPPDNPVDPNKAIADAAELAIYEKGRFYLVAGDYTVEEKAAAATIIANARLEGYDEFEGVEAVVEPADNERGFVLLVTKDTYTTTGKPVYVIVLGEDPDPTFAELLEEHEYLKATDDGLLLGLVSGGGVTVEELEAEFNLPPDWILVAYGLDDEVLDEDDVIGTGTKLVLYDGEGREVAYVVIVVLGDLTGNGTTSGEDIMKLLGHIRFMLHDPEFDESFELEGAFFEAANFSGGATLDGADIMELLILMRLILDR
jgi:hypothetical protein